MKSGSFSNLFIVLALLLSTFSVPAAAAAAPASPATESTAPIGQGNWTDKVDPLILEELVETGQADFFIVFKDTADLSPAYSMSWHDRGYFVVDTLKAMAERSQVNVRKWLAEQNIRYTVFWINNSLFVHADQAALEALAAFPEVAELKGNHVAHIFDDEPAGASQVEGEIMAPAYPWNITFPMADQVHAQYGVKGQGVVVGGMDTGAEYTHMGLVQNYRGCLNPPTCTVFDHTYSWYDPSSSCGGAPCDTDGHGTATMGIMAGDDDPALPTGAWIGMAPDAQWIHCLGCPYGSCPDYDTTACAQWFLAPGGNPNLRPQVVNHSWGTWSPNDCQGNAFQTELMAYRAADIVPAFAAGNVGDACNSSTSPANNTDPAGNPIAFASGAHGIDGSLDYYSSCGWNACNPTKLFPDVASPGLNSCTTGTGNTYNCSFGGTSSASPHTAGCVALVRSANPTLSVADVEQVIRDAANDVDDTSCGGTIDWNNRYGEGHLDCYEAVQLAGVGGMGTLNGTVTDANTSLPLEDASIDATLTPTRTWHTTTDELGYYEVRVMTGTLTVEAWKYGYVPAVTSTNVYSGVTTTENFALYPAVMYTVDGTVTDATTGWPLYARIDIDGYPYNPVWTDPETGYYSVSLAEGVAYDFVVNAWVPGYLPAGALVGPLTGNTTVDFALDVDQGACIAPGYQMSLTDYFFDDFEAGYTAWTMDGLWNPENQSDTCGSIVAPFPSPTNASYYGLDGVCTFNNGATNSGSLTMSAPTSLPAAGAAFLSFASYEQTECSGDCGYDNRYVEISSDGGASWTLLGEAASEGAWYTAWFDLGAYVGSNVQIRFRFDTVDSAVNDYFGWMVDDVAIQTGVCEPQAGGLVVGNTYDLNTGLPLAGVTVANDAGYSTVSVPTPDDPAVDDSFYTLFSPPGDHLFTASKSLYGSTSLTVTMVSGTTVEQDFYLGTGELVANPTSLAVTLDMGLTDTEPLTLTNVGNADANFEIAELDRGFEPARMPGHGQWLYQAMAAVEMAANRSGQQLAYPKAYRWQPDAPAAALNILVYADDYIHIAPNTFLDQALQALGLGYTAHYDGDWTGFEADLTGGTWDLVLVGDDNYGPPESVFTALNNHVLGGGKLVFHGWTVASYASHPLWSTLGFTFISNDTDPPDPIYWWDPGHPIFTTPQAVPEFTVLTSGIYGTYGQYVEPLAGLEAIAGYTTPGPDPNQAAMVVANEGRTVFKGFLDGQNSADLDGDSAFDGVELWTNLIDGIQHGFAGDVPWLSEDPISGTVPVAGHQVIDVTFDSTGVTQPGDYQATLSINNDTPYGPLQVPVTMTVVPPPTYGKLEGTVIGLGYCDTDPAPLEEAEMIVESSLGVSWTLATDEAGHYLIWLDQANSPLTIHVTYPEHEDGLAAGVLVTGQQTTTVDFYLRWLQPCLSVTPDSLAATLDMGATDTQQMTVTNSGAAPAMFEFQEQDNGFSPTSIAGMNPTGQNLPVYAPPTVIAAPTIAHSYTDGHLAPADSGSVESPPAPSRYTDSALALVYYGDRATFDADYPGLPVEGFENTLVPDGNIVACDGPFDSATDNACFAPGGILDGIRLMNVDPINQMVVIGDGALGQPSALVGPNTFVDDHDLIFYDGGVNAVGLDLWSPMGEATFDLYIYGPGDVLLGQTSVLAQTTGTFWGVASNTPITRIRTTSTAGAGELFDDIAFGGGGDVPWLSESPISGTVPADGGQAVVDVTFDAGVVGQPGEYWATLNVKSDDPVNGTVGLPVTMTVIAPPDWGILEGTVTGLGYCDGDSYPLADAVVLIEGTSGMTWTTTTDGAGYYVWWLDSVDSPYIVSVTAEGHLGAQVTGVVINPGGATTTVDFALRWLQPCLSVTPDSLAATLDLGASETQQMTLTNSGAAPAIFDLQEMDRGYAPNAEGGVPAYTPPVASAAKPGSLLDSGPADVHGTAAPVTMQGEILLDQAPNQVNGLFSDSDCANCPTGQQSIAENFYLAEGAAIGQIVFWTGYWPADTPIDPDQITVIFHEDASGYPGTAIYTEADVAYERVQTGVVLFGVHEWMHTLTLGSPVILEPGNYWVEIYNNTAGNSDQFFWETGNLDPGAGLTGSAFAFETPGQAWNYDSATDLAIQLIEGGGDVPWLSEAPISGTVPADGGQVVVDVTFDAGAVALPGEYWATLNVRSDDPVNGTIGLPVTMTVIAPPDWGILEGTVTGMGHCDAESYPLEGATVVAADGGVMTVTTDVNGEYAVWLEAGTYEVVASAEGHTEASAQVTIVGQQTTIQDFALRSLQPCMSLTPPAMEAILLPGTAETQPLTLINDGAAPSDFVIRETTRTVEILGLGMVTIAPSADADLSSTTTPDGYVPALTHSSSPGAHLMGGTVAIFKDADPWGSVSTEAVLAANGIPYEVHGSGEFGTLDFGAFGMIVINSDQPQAFYDTYALYVDKFEDYVQGGGYLNFFSADAGWNGGYLSAPLPGGMVWTTWYEDYNAIDDPAHPVVQGVPDPFYGTSASHGYFSNLPADAHVIVHGNDSGQPNLVEYPLGDGWFIGFGQTAEISYDWGWEGGPILPNALLYGYAFEPAGDVPWVSEDPITGTVLADDQLPVDVTFTALPTMPLGVYTATLVINTDDAQEPQLTVPVTLTIVDCMPVTGVDLAVLTADPIFPGDAVDLEADVEPDDASKPYSYTVDYGDETPLVTGSSSDDPLALSHSYAAAGSYTVTVSVWNCDMTEPVADTAVVAVQVPCAPVTGLDFGWMPVAPVAGEMVSFDATVTGGDEPITYTWSFGDGETAVGVSVTHAFALAADYTVWLTATNCSGEGVAVISHTLTVAVVPPPIYYYYLPITVKAYND
ncbi:MAG: carboxypeptidase regulatory-like domain-containing protein [Anaerolineae bacterium]|nr:carboxypeptidase regulatory-like domain-containing protein [Anaerolineae bacterium]